MKFNITYTSDPNLLKTFKDIEDIKTRIIKSLNSLKSFTKVTAPLFLEENDLKILDLASKTRSVSFDFGQEYKVGILSLTHTNWLRDIVYRTNIPSEEGLFTDSSYIWRDLPFNPSSSPIKDEMTFQFRVPEDEVNEKTKDIVQDVYELINEINSYYKEKQGIKNSFPEFAKYISAQQLAIEMPRETPKQRETDTILENHAFILESPGFKLYSGETHSLIPSALYDLKNFYQILLLDKVNSVASKVASVGILSSGQTLVDQLNLHDLTELLTNNFYANLIKRRDKIVEIKLNIPRIAMIILNKGHIGEVQAGVISNEAETIKEKNNVKII